MATIISISQTEVSSEICCISLTLIYSLIALHLSSSNWIFRENVATSFRLTSAEFGATNLIVKQTRPLIYLAGAKLLTVFCYFLPFACIVSPLLYQPNVSVGDVNNTTNQHIFNDLIVLLLTRLALGTITALVLHHNVNCSSIVYLGPVVILFAVVLLIPLLDLEHLFAEFKFSTVMIIYVALSLLFDVIGHRAALSIDLDLRSAPTIISLTFATFIEHLIDVTVVVVYLNDWISAKIIITALMILCLSILCQKITTPLEQNNNYIEIKSQIL